MTRVGQVVGPCRHELLLLWITLPLLSDLAGASQLASHPGIQGQAAELTAWGR